MPPLHKGYVSYRCAQAVLEATKQLADELHEVRQLDTVLGNINEKMRRVVSGDTTVTRGSVMQQYVKWKREHRGNLDLRQGTAFDRITDEALARLRSGDFLSPLDDAHPAQDMERGTTLDEVECIQLDGAHTIVCGCSRMSQTIRDAHVAGNSHASVLIGGPSGSGKELIARLVHMASPRRAKPFVAVSCATFTNDLASDELFGHVDGAYTGAKRARPGLFGVANGGTLFLDEIHCLPPPVQAKLLRVLQEHEMYMVGDREHPLEADARVIAASSDSLIEKVAAGEFPQALYYRLATFNLAVPPLRLRGDIKLLTDTMLKRANDRNGTAVPVAPDVYGLLTDYPWPGNVRQLENVMEEARALATAKAADAAIDHEIIMRVLSRSDYVSLIRIAKLKEWRAK